MNKNNWCISEHFWSAEFCVCPVVTLQWLLSKTDWPVVDLECHFYFGYLLQTKDDYIKFIKLLQNTFFCFSTVCMK
jgi:hypothetical protein